MKPGVVPGLTAEHRHRVVTANLVSHFVQGGPPVFGSPFMLFVMECAAANVLLPFLDDGEQSLGVDFEFKHLAATPAGASVVGRAEIIEVEGPRVSFRVEAHDEHERIGAGLHVRHVVQMSRFLDRLKRKTTA